MKLKIIAICLAALSTQVVAKEQNININGMVGILETPDNQTSGNIVLIFHGFMGNKNDLQIKGTDEGVLERAASALSKNGIASLRIDFRGSGDSEGEWENTTFSKQIKDGNEALQWIRTNTYYKPQSIGLLGWSQGGLIASHVASSNPDIKAVTLWTPVTTPYLTYSKIMGTNVINEALVSEDDTIIEYKTQWGQIEHLKAKFFKEILSTQGVAAISSYKMPLMVLTGKNDDLVLTGSNHAWSRYHNGETKLVEFDSNHVWNAFDGPTVIDNLVMPTTISWFNEKL